MKLSCVTVGQRRRGCKFKFHKFHTMLVIKQRLLLFYCSDDFGVSRKRLPYSPFSSSYLTVAPKDGKYPIGTNNLKNAEIKIQYLLIPY